MGCHHFDETHHMLLTSDRPIVMTNGLAHATSHIVMPISPRRIFVAANNRETVKDLHDMAEAGGMAQRLNNRMADRLGHMCTVWTTARLNL
jgi:hypothetical protein